MPAATAITAAATKPADGLSTAEAISRIGCTAAQLRYLIRIGALEEATVSQKAGQHRRSILWTHASIDRVAQAKRKFEETNSWGEALRWVDRQTAALTPRQKFPDAGDIIAIGIRKGGVGKTTITYNLAGALAAQNAELARKKISAAESLNKAESDRLDALTKPVLLVDLDPQATLTRKFFEEFDANDLKYTVAEIFGEDPEHAIRQAIQRTWLKHIDLLPMRPQSRRVFADSDPARLAEWAIDLHTRHVPTKHWRNEFEERIAKELVKLKDALDTVRHEYGQILIDCANNVTFVIQAGLLAADGLIIPTGHDVESFDGYLDLCEDLQWLKRTTGKSPTVLGLLGNILFPRDAVGAWVLERYFAPALKKHGHEFFQAELRRTASIKEAMTALRPLAFQTRASQGKAMFTAAAAELRQRLDKAKGHTHKRSGA